MRRKSRPTAADAPAQAPIKGSYVTSQHALTGCPHRLFLVVCVHNAANGITNLECCLCGARDIVEPQSYGYIEPAAKEAFDRAIQALEEDERRIKGRLGRLRYARSELDQQPS